MSKARDLADFQGSASTLTTGTLPVDRVPYVGRRNLIINGGFDVWQRGTSFSGVLSGYIADRWLTYRGGSGSVTASQVTLSNTDKAVTGCDYAMQFQDTSSSNSGRRLDQRIEGDISKYVGKDLTLSFWVKADQATSFSYTIIEGGSSADTDNLISSGLEVTTSWVRKTITFTNIQASGNYPDYIVVGLRINNGDTSTFQITGVQLELGSVATPFEHRSYGEELALCQRYYCKSYEVGVPAGTGGYADGNYFRYLDGGHNWANAHFEFPVNMRAKPTMRMWHPSSGELGKVQCDSSSPTCGIAARGTKSALAGVSNIYISTSVSFSFHWEADAEL